MRESQLILYTQSRPFEPFRIFIADAREIDIKHPEMTALAKYAMALWIFHSEGEMEVVETELITGLKTLKPVNPSQFAGSQIEE